MSYQYILYAVPGDKNSEKAIQMPDWGQNDISLDGQIKFVNPLQLRQWPHWMTGVPILANRQTREIWKGTHCLRELEQIASVVEDDEMRMQPTIQPEDPPVEIPKDPREARDRAEDPRPVEDRRTLSPTYAPRADPAVRQHARAEDPRQVQNESQIRDPRQAQNESQIRDPRQAQNESQIRDPRQAQNESQIRDPAVRQYARTEDPRPVEDRRTLSPTHVSASAEDIRRIEPQRDSESPGAATRINDDIRDISSQPKEPASLKPVEPARVIQSPERGGMPYTPLEVKAPPPSASFPTTRPRGPPSPIREEEPPTAISISIPENVTFVEETSA
jgi:hypothetical protein